MKFNSSNTANLSKITLLFMFVGILANAKDQRSKKQKWRVLFVKHTCVEKLHTSAHIILHKTWPPVEIELIVMMMEVCIWVYPHYLYLIITVEQQENQLIAR